MLTPFEHIRKRPGMYVGGTDARAMHILVSEVLNHMVEETFAGRCNHIWVELRENNEILMRDNSSGLSVEPYQGTNLTRMEALLQMWNVSKSDIAPENYRVAGGLHGVGLPIVSALSEELRVQNRSNGFLWQKIYRHGEPASGLEKIALTDGAETGTTFIFRPDFSIFELNDFDFKMIEKRASELAYQLSELEITISDLRVHPTYRKIFHYPDGLKTFITIMHPDSVALRNPVHIRENVIIVRKNSANVTAEIEIAFQFYDMETSHVFNYVNTVEISDGGTHLIAFKAALLSYFNEYLEVYDHQVSPFTWDEISRGLTAVVAIYHPDPQFRGAIKSQIMEPGLFGPVAGAVYAAFNPDTDRENASRLVKYYLARRKNFK